MNGLLVHRYRARIALARNASHIDASGTQSVAGGERFLIVKRRARVVQW